MMRETRDSSEITTPVMQSVPVPSMREALRPRPGLGSSDTRPRCSATMGTAGVAAPRIPEEARHLLLTLLLQRTKKLGWMIGYQSRIELLSGMGGRRRSDLYSWQGIYGGEPCRNGACCAQRTRQLSL